MGHNKYIISLKYWESKLLECYLLSQSRKDILLCSQYISYIPSFISAREPPLQETHQGVQSLTVPALQPVRHTFVMPNPSIHFSPLWHKYIFPFFHLLSLFYQGQTWTPWKTHTHTHTSRAGRSPGPVILHLHLSRLADALIQGDLQRQCNGRAEREWSDVGEGRRAEGGDVRFICIYYNLGSWFGDLLIPEIHLSKI